MKNKKTWVFTALVACFGSAQATNLNGMVKINEGHFAALGEDGRVVEVATNDTVKKQFEQQITEKYEAQTRKAIAMASTSGTGDAIFCTAYDVGQVVDNGGPVVNGGLITLSGYSRVWQSQGPFPPQPKFAYTRTKAKLKGFYADGSLSERDYQITRDPRHNGSAVYTMDSNNQIMSAEYSKSAAQAQISATNVDNFTWVVRSEIIVDNPVSDDGSVPQDQDCYDAISIRVFNSVDL